MDFNDNAATYCETDVADLGIPSVNVFNCVGIEEFGFVVDFWRDEHGPEMLKVLSLRALAHCNRFMNDDDAEGMFAFVCDQGICRSSAVVLTLLVASGRLMPSEIAFAAEYLVFDKSEWNLVRARRAIMMHSGPAILEAAALMGHIDLPF
jgi:hypothetical protein